MARVLNKHELSKNKWRSDILEIFEEGLRVADPKKAVGDALGKLENDICNASRIFVIGFGKASLIMAQGCEERLKEIVQDYAVIMPNGFKKIGSSRVKVFEGTHPIPSKINIESTEKLIRVCSNLAKEDLVICLISGGGSSLLTLPAEDVSLEDKIMATEILIKSGAEIKEINTIRKHISRVKGGQLVSFLKPAKVISLIVSDIVGDPVEYIASGPTSPDPSTFEDAYTIIRKYNLESKLPGSVLERIRRGLRKEVPETPKPGDQIFDNVKNIVVLNNMKSLAAMKSKADELGYNTLILTSYMQGEAREVGKFVSSVMKQVSNHNTPVEKPACLIMGGETTVTVKGRGRGGRNQELVLSVVNSYRPNKNFVFASIGSDGVDGYSDAAGAIADFLTVETVSEKGLDPEDFLRENDSYNFFKQTDGLIFTGVTGTNVNDFAIALVY